LYIPLVPPFKSVHGSNSARPVVWPDSETWVFKFPYRTSN